MCILSSLSYIKASPPLSAWCSSGWTHHAGASRADDSESMPKACTHLVTIWWLGTRPERFGTFYSRFNLLTRDLNMTVCLSVTSRYCTYTTALFTAWYRYSSSFWTKPPPKYSNINTRNGLVKYKGRKNAKFRPKSSVHGRLQAKQKRLVFFCFLIPKMRHNSSYTTDFRDLGGRSINVCTTR